jgi:hypothetical protein
MSQFHIWELLNQGSQVQIEILCSLHVTSDHKEDKPFQLYQPNAQFIISIYIK